MTTLLGVLMLAAPLAALVALVALVDRRRAREHAGVAMQVALTDALHARLGAVVAPFVRWHRRRWEITVAVPLERPAVVAGVLATVEEVFGRAPWEVTLRRQPVLGPSTRAPRVAPLGRRESLSWT